jgi:hypothetical protein
VVNTVVLTKDPPQILNSETPGRSNMELDDVSVCPVRYISALTLTVAFRPVFKPRYLAVVSHSVCSYFLSTILVAMLESSHFFCEF